MADDWDDLCLESCDSAKPLVSDDALEFFKLFSANDCTIDFIDPRTLIRFTVNDIIITVSFIDFENAQVSIDNNEKLALYVWTIQRKIMKKKLDLDFDSTILDEVRDVCEITGCNPTTAFFLLTKYNRDVFRATNALINNENVHYSESEVKNKLFRVNVLLALENVITETLNNLNSRCLICDAKHPCATVRPIICDSHLCFLSYTDFGIGLDIIGLLRINKNSLELYLSLLSLSQRVELFNNIRGFKNLGTEDINSIFRDFPSIDEMLATYGQLKSVSKFTTHYNNINPLILQTIKWIIATCPNDIEKKVVYSQFKTENQYALNFTTPEKDANNGKPPKIVFHGSPISNWFSILFTGLKIMSNTKYMTSGAAYGTGVYFSDDSSVSYGYSSGCTNKVWKHSIIDSSIKIVAVCEIVDRYEPKPHYVVDDESDIRCTCIVLLTNNPTIKSDQIICSQQK
jgi:hypothetical protein